MSRSLLAHCILPFWSRFLCMSVAVLLLAECVHAHSERAKSTLDDLLMCKEKVSYVKFFGRELIDGKVYWAVAEGGKEDAKRVISQLARHCGLQDESFKDGLYAAGFAGEFVFLDSKGRQLGSLRHINSLIVVSVPPKKVTAFEASGLDTSAFVSREIKSGMTGENTWKVHIAEKKRDLPDEK
jgi:hypothetical protein